MKIWHKSAAIGGLAIVILLIGLNYQTKRQSSYGAVKDDNLNSTSTKIDEVVEGVSLETTATTSTTKISKNSTVPAESKKTNNKSEDLKNLPNSEWKKRLTANQYAILRLGGTEVPYTSDLVNEKRKGSYVTVDCGELVFRSEQKFDSGTGWPSFYAPASPSSVIEKPDNILAVSRTEITSPICGSHLGHVFKDAPQTPTGLRYCINGLALRFIPDKIQ